MLKAATNGNTREIVHDLNNLLTAIVAHSELLKERAGEDATLLRHADELHRAAERAASLVQRLQAHEIASGG